MLSPVSLVDQWRRLARSLDPNWTEARLRLEVDRAADRAAALLGPLNPGRKGNEIFILVGRRGEAPGPEAVLRLLRKLDGERIRGRLELLGTARQPAGAPAAEPVTKPEPAEPVTTLVESWEAELGRLPSDWSDLWAEVQLLSSDYLERAALLMAPLNPRAAGGRTALSFRCARRQGYGASQQMVRRCLERCDEAGIRGTDRVLRVLSDTDPVQTQGPVLYVGEKRPLRAVL